jgi:rhodanese-related sulfurtransferase
MCQTSPPGRLAERAVKACEVLQSLGYRAARPYMAGLEGWRAGGGAVETE